jgi:signal transduction histidine kinase
MFSPKSGRLWYLRSPCDPDRRVWRRGQKPDTSWTATLQWGWAPRARIVLPSLSMKSLSTEAADSDQAIPPPKISGRLFRKYVTLFVGVVCVALIANSISETWIAYLEQKAFLIRAQHDRAETAADKIAQFVKEIEGQIGWTTQLPWMPGDLEDRHIDAVRLLRQMPAIAELRQLDRLGREQVHVSRRAPDVVGSNADLSQDIRFVEAMTKEVYYGPVYFLQDSEPHMTIAMAGERSDALVSVADVNLKLIWDLVSQMKVGAHGQAYLVDGEGRLIAHPDISLVLRNTDLAHLLQVRAARMSPSNELSEQETTATDLQGRPVLTTYAPIAPLGWLVFVELPLNEAYSALYASIARSGLLLLAALALAVVAGMFLARRMIVPIRELRIGAARIGSGDLTRRISIRTGDELEALGDQFNSMAAQLHDSYATLERKVEERTQQLELANLAKSRFLAAASHDLRQPLHALGLFVAQLQASIDAPDRGRIVERIGAAVAAMNELFGALLDISKLDAGVLDPNITEFPVAHLLQRLETTFAGAAHEKDLSLQVVPSEAWIRSDFILLERVLLNLVSNAIRYTSRGGAVVGCRRRDRSLRIEVYDTGVGIPTDQRQKIFAEFYRLGDAHDNRAGLGLGLAIVDRLCRLLDHPIELASTSGKGSRFAVIVPLLESPPGIAAPPIAPPTHADALRGKLVVVIDDDALVLESMSGLLKGWDCRVVAAPCFSDALAGVEACDRLPDLIISDYHLSDGMSGIDAIERLRRGLRTTTPAFLISGDINAERVRETRERGYYLLHKPVSPIALRAILNKLLKHFDIAGAA